MAMYVGNPTNPNQKHCDTAVLSVLNSNAIQSLSNTTFNCSKIPDVQINSSLKAETIEVDYLKIPDGGPHIVTYNNGRQEGKKLADILKEVTDELSDADIVLKGKFADYHIDYREKTHMTIRHKIETGTLLELPDEMKKTTTKRVHTDNINAILSVCRTLMSNHDYLELQQKIFERI